MFTTDGECSTGLSIGPICNSMARVSRNSSASGISFHAKRGTPMSTVNRPSAPFQQLSMPAVVSKVERALAALLRHQVGDAAHAVAAGAGLRTVIVVDADEGIGAGRARRIERHQLIVGRALRAPRPRALPRARSQPPRARRSTTTISLPMPFIFTKDWLASAPIIIAYEFGQDAAFARVSPGLYGE